MKPKFALNLSHEGIVLLHLSSGGKWTIVGEVALDDPNLSENLSFLRSTGVALEGKGFGSKLIIPESQILFTKVTAPGPDDAARREQIAAALVGQTPYDVKDLAFDWHGDGDEIDVAVVARETLDEAEEFAVDHRFNPLSFVAQTTLDGAPWEPFFGRSDYSYAFLDHDVDVRDEADTVLEPAARKQPVSPDLFDEDSDADTEPLAASSDGVIDNIFAETEDGDDQDEAEPAAPELGAAEPAFTSRRSASSEIDLAAESLISRVSPRIAISAEPALEPASPELDLAPLIAERPERLAKPPKKRRALGLTKPLGALFRKSGARIKQTAGTTLTVATAASRRGLASLARKAKPKPKADKPADFVTREGLANRTLVVLGGVAFLLLAVVLLVYFWVWPSNQVSQTDFKDDRPTQEASLKVDENTGTHKIPVIRPERRSVYEGKLDPDADKPDTAQPVTSLSAEELADIRASGLPDPTHEELAEGEEAQTEGLDDATVAAEYAATGILIGLKELPIPIQAEERDDIYVASVDRPLGANDATILPDFNTGVQDDQPHQRMSPLGPLVKFDLDPRGLVKATAEGALNPEGILVYFGKPSVVPPVKPKTEELVPPDPLRALTPKARPADLKTGADAIYVQGTLTLAELRALRAKPRPESEQDLQTGEDHNPTELAVLTSFKPSHRPSDFASIVEKANATMTAANTSNDSTLEDNEPDTTSAPILPTRASVAKQATIKNALNPNNLNLIGVYGTPSKRRALLRLPSGRYVKVEIGDRVDGGRVAAIDVDSLSYVKSGRNRVLKIPQ